MQVMDTVSLYLKLIVIPPDRSDPILSNFADKKFIVPIISIFPISVKPRAENGTAAGGGTFFSIPN
jgi:hypothetical protein